MKEKSIKQKPLTKTEIKILKEMVRVGEMGYGRNLMNTADYPFTKVIRNLISKKLAEPTHQSGTWVTLTRARITDAGRKALESSGDSS